MKIFQTVGRYVFSTEAFNDLLVHSINKPEEDLEYRVAKTSTFIIFDAIHIALNPKSTHLTQWRML